MAFAPTSSSQGIDMQYGCDGGRVRSCNIALVALIVIATELTLAGAVLQLLGLQSGAYGADASVRGRMRYAAPSIICLLIGAVLMLLGAASVVL